LIESFLKLQSEKNEPEAETTSMASHVVYSQQNEKTLLIHHMCQQNTWLSTRHKIRSQKTSRYLIFDTDVQLNKIKCSAPGDGN